MKVWKNCIMISSIALGLLLSSCHLNLSGPVAVKNATKKDFKVVGYLHSGNFNQIDQIELHRLTHLDIAFANPDENGHLFFRQENELPTIVRKAHDANVQVYLSIAGGGIDEKLAGQWLKVLQPENRETFIREIVDFAKKYNLNGIDVDIEWNLIPTITSLYTPFVVELKNALHASGMGISSALNVKGLHESVTQESLEAYDFINVMVYDKTGIWRPEKPGPHAPYDYAEEALKYWTEERKIPAEKLTLGVPFYGHDFETLRYISYRKLIEKNPAYAYQDEIEATFYNGIPMIVQKTELAKKSFGGVMIWELGNDVFSELSLLRAIDQTINAGKCSTVTTFYADEDGDGYGDLKKPFQACKAPRHYVINRDDCDDSDKNIHPDASEIADGKDQDCDGKIDE